MRLSLNLQLPQHDLRVGTPNMHPLSYSGDVHSRSYVGYDGREDNRFFPLVKALECLTAINLWQWERFAKEGYTPPRLYDSGVFYQQEPVKPVPMEEWLDFPTLYMKGYGDCEDLACARAGELQHDGIAAVPAIRYKKIQDLTLIPVLVLLPNGEIEDPSAKLGMKGGPS